MELIPVDDHITAIDHHLLGIPGVGVTYVVRGEAVALVETGTALTVPRTLAGLAALGIRAEEVEHILCTHVHMDHAGGAGYLAAALPRAAVYFVRGSASAPPLAAGGEARFRAFERHGRSLSWYTVHTHIRAKLCQRRSRKPIVTL